MVVQNAKLGEVGCAYFAAGVVGQTLVALGVVSLAHAVKAGGVQTSSLSNQYALMFAGFVVNLGGR